MFAALTTVHSLPPLSVRSIFPTSSSRPGTSIPAAYRASANSLEEMSPSCDAHRRFAVSCCKMDAQPDKRWAGFDGEAPGLFFLIEEWRLFLRHPRRSS